MIIRQLDEPEGDLTGWSFHSRILPSYHQSAILTHPNRFEGLKRLLDHEMPVVEAALLEELSWKQMVARARGPTPGELTEASCYNELHPSTYPALEKLTHSHKIGMEEARDQVLKSQATCDVAKERARAEYTEKQALLKTAAAKCDHDFVDKTYDTVRTNIVTLQKEFESIPAPRQ